jgi:spore maturation protein CgeB
VIDKSGVANQVQVNTNADLVLFLSSDVVIKGIDKKRDRLVRLLWMAEPTSLKKIFGGRRSSFDYDLIFDTSGVNVAESYPAINSSHYLPSISPHSDIQSINERIINKWSQELRLFLHRVLVKNSVAIKIPVRKWGDCYSWGDYYLAQHLKEALTNEGYSVLLQTVPEWNNKKSKQCNVVIALRGVVKYKPEDYQVNLMWNISHPDSVEKSEYEQYDKIFVASESYANRLMLELDVPVEVMLQCTDVSQFYEPDHVEKNQYGHQLLFIGNSRKAYKKRLMLFESIHKGLFSGRFDSEDNEAVLPYNRVTRKIIRDLWPTSYDLAIYGLRWDKHVDKQVIKGSYIPNHELYKYYGSAEILLNDHWKDMRKLGFVSNRIFDGLACGAFIISDDIEGIGELQKYITTYSSKAELQNHIDYYLLNPQERVLKAQAGKAYVLKNHTFAHRASQFSKAIQSLSNS